jgi:hypothetical protein
MTADPFARALLGVAAWLAAYAVASLAAGLVLGRLMAAGGADDDPDDSGDEDHAAHLYSDGCQSLGRVPSGVLSDRQCWLVEILDTSPRAPSTPNAHARGADHARRRTHRIDRATRRRSIHPGF